MALRTLDRRRRIDHIAEDYYGAPVTELQILAILRANSLIWNGSAFFDAGVTLDIPDAITDWDFSGRFQPLPEDSEPNVRGFTTEINREARATLARYQNVPVNPVTVGMSLDRVNFQELDNLTAITQAAQNRIRTPLRSRLRNPEYGSQFTHTFLSATRNTELELTISEIVANALEPDRDWYTAQDVTVDYLPNHTLVTVHAMVVSTQTPIQIQVEV